MSTSEIALICLGHVFRAADLSLCDLFTRRVSARSTILTVAFVVCLATSAVPAATVYVSMDGDDSNDGLSRSSSVATLDRAVSISTSPADRIEVATGSYPPQTINFSPRTAGWKSSLLITAAEKAEVVLESVEICAARITISSLQVNNSIRILPKADNVRLEYVVG